MRELKFRAWHPDEGKYYYFKSFSEIAKWQSDDAYRSESDGNASVTFEQYTGLNDTNGVEIYEGDIVVQDGYIWFVEGKPNYRGTVEWIYSQWHVIAHCVNPDKRGISDGMNYGLNDEGFDEGENSDWEVIGNIHDNPELLRWRE